MATVWEMIKGWFRRTPTEEKGIPDNGPQYQRSVPAVSKSKKKKATKKKPSTAKKSKSPKKKPVMVTPKKEAPPFEEADITIVVDETAPISLEEVKVDGKTTVKKPRKSKTSVDTPPETVKIEITDADEH